jgi:hypothetical protein
MFYRLSCVLEDGTIRGYQWREVTLEEFVSIATGSRPRGDTDSQTRDSTDYDTAAQNRTIYYGHVHKPGTGWVTDLDYSTAEAMYAECGHERAGN